VVAPKHAQQKWPHTTKLCNHQGTAYAVVSLGVV
jgi:hypothetical protein